MKDTEREECKICGAEDPKNADSVFIHGKCQPCSNLVCKAMGFVEGSGVEVHENAEEYVRGFVR